MSAEARAPGTALLEADMERRLGRWLARGLPVLAVAGAVATALLADAGTALLVLAASALLAVIALLWASVRTLAGDAPPSIDEAFGAVASGTEEQYQVVLRAIRDLEQEHALGKVDDADFRELRAGWREQAKRLLRTIEQQRAPLREEAAAWAEARLAGRPLARPGACAGCGTDNDADAAFCKRCGAKLGGAVAT